MPSESAVLNTVYDAVFMAFIKALGGEGNEYPLTAQGLHDTISNAVENAMLKHLNSKDV